MELAASVLAVGVYTDTFEGEKMLVQGVIGTTKKGSKMNVSVGATGFGGGGFSSEKCVRRMSKFDSGEA